MLRRLGGLAVTGNQPALQVHIKATEDEKAKVARCIMQQKIGSNPKALKTYDELQDRKQISTKHREDTQTHDHGAEKILVKFARIATGCKVKWTRSFRRAAAAEATEEEEDGSLPKAIQQYRSRMLACTRCGEEQETKKMQLRTVDGYRAIHCRGCGKQERVSNNMCQCRVIWHICSIHRIDPQTHASRKGIKGSGKRGLDEKQLSSTRKGPTTRCTGPRKPLAKRTIHKERLEAGIVTHAKFIRSEAPPSDALLHKLRTRIKAEGGMSQSDQQRTKSGCEEAYEAQRPSKVRRINDACAVCPKSFGLPGSRNIRSSFTSSLSQRIKEQASRIVTLQYFKNSRSNTASTSMRFQCEDHGLGCDQRTLQGSTLRSTSGTKFSEEEAICRILNNKSH